MQRIIKNGQILDETWHLLPADASLDSVSNSDDLIVPLALWREHAHALKARDGGWACGWKPVRKSRKSSPIWIASR